VAEPLAVEVVLVRHCVSHRREHCRAYVGKELLDVPDTDRLLGGGDLLHPPLHRQRLRVVVRGPLLVARRLAHQRKGRVDDARVASLFGLVFVVVVVAGDVVVVCVQGVGFRVYGLGLRRCRV
jgi:hypothetical protein